MPKVAKAIRTAEVFVPRLSEPSRSFIVAPSLVLTRKIPMRERNTPTAAMIIGAMTARSCMSSFMAKAVAPSAAVERILPQ